MKRVVTSATRDARVLADEGCDALIIENMGDVPYLKGAVPAETIAAFTVAAHAVAQLGTKLPIGIQVLAAANREALGIAVATGARFVRVEAFAYAHVADEGWIDASAGELLRARRALGADVHVWADVQKKHAAHAVTDDLRLDELAQGHAFAGADALIVTGKATGRPTSIDDVRSAKSAGRPVLVGSGVTPDNAEALAAEADGLIVGSWLKRDGGWQNEVDPERVRRMRGLVVT